MKANFNNVLPASNDDVAVFGKLDQQEITAAQEVEKWFNEWQSTLLKLENDFTKQLISEWDMGRSTAERRTELLSEVLAEAECVLKEHDTFGLGHDVLRKCVTRMAADLYARAIRPLEIFITANSDIGVLGDNDM
jgi:hypothetical protein